MPLVIVVPRYGDVPTRRQRFTDSPVFLSHSFLYLPRMEWRVSRLIVVAVVVCFAFHLLYVLFVSLFKSYQGFFFCFRSGPIGVYVFVLVACGHESLQRY